MGVNSIRGGERLRASRVVVLSGGRSSERAVSLKSGAAIVHALRDDVDAQGPREVVSIEIDEAGRWSWDGRVLSPHAALNVLPSDAVFFLALHGGDGEDGTLQGFFATCGRAHTGSGVAASSLCMGKSATRSVLRDVGLAVAAGFVVHPLAWRDDRATCLARARALSENGFAVKPDRGGSSVATFVIDGPEELERSIEAVLATGDLALVEARVRGIECTVGVLGEARGAAHALPPVEIVPKAGRFFDYDEKYGEGGAREVCPPETIDDALCSKLRAHALRAFRAAGCDGYARIDFIVPEPAHELTPDAQPIVLEINTLPGMTARSLLPLAAAADGISFRSLCLRIVEAALARSPRTHAVEVAS